MRKQLILITGVGNYDRLFEFFAFVWQFFGFEAHVGAFGWSDRPELFEKKIQKLLADIDSLEGKPVYIVGSSAGGTAAVHALAARPKAVVKIATLCSPLQAMQNLRNPLLEKSIAKLPESFAKMDDATRKKILSVYAARDTVVAANLSKPAGVRTYRLLTRGHGFTIFTALTIFSFPLRTFFRSR